MTFFTAEVDETAAAALAESREGGSGKFPPLPRGEYRATVVPLSMKEGGKRLEVADFGGPGANAKKKVLRIAVRIADDSPTGAKRTFFVRVPLFSRWAPKDGAAVGKPATQYFQFFGALGVSDEALASGNLGIGPEQILGKPINIVLGEPKEPDSYNPLGFNEVSFFNKPGPCNTPLRAAGVSVAPWLDADDNLLAGFQAGSQVTQASAASAPPVNPWAVSEGDLARAQAAMGAAPAAETVGAVAPGAWANAPAY